MIRPSTRKEKMLAAACEEAAAVLIGCYDLVSRMEAGEQVTATEFRTWVAGTAQVIVLFGHRIVQDEGIRGYAARLADSFAAANGCSSRMIIERATEHFERGRRLRSGELDNGS